MSTSSSGPGGRPVPAAPRLGGTVLGSADDKVAKSPIFRQLVEERTRFGWILTGLMLAVYFGFIGLIAFDKSLLAVKIGSGTASLGLLLGVLVILFAFILTGIYVQRANGRYDDLTAALKRDLGR
ncbi:DUF485 domain-containing protein [Methylobacterium sp. WL12]|uniref:DUF485 domain-containing protein n=1 Tax=unclassified Methylobacterium TaxID=2615210 RepID=UPI0011CB869B|nr:MULTISPECIES: DUF485 domain-containing protein [unclassified Methylobacterium]TXM69429.1 DUF485 domain-containing protein [Methylobacterium sp. WL12]TXM69771.1 DUF485 domain-containing protein [Methylobacterium sp. WL120]